MDFATNELNLKTARHKTKGGRPLTRNGMAYLLGNPFYYGFFKWDGELYRGAYKPMVSKEEWDMAQRILGSSNGHQTRPKGKKYDFLLSNIFRCGKCGYAIVSEHREKLLKDGSTKSYVYCHCSGKCKDFKCPQKSIYITEEELVDQIKQEISKYTIPQEILEIVCLALDEEEIAIMRENKRDKGSISAEIKRVDGEIDALNRAFVRSCGEMSVEWYQEEQEKLKAERANLANRLEQANSCRSWRSIAEDTLMFARYAKEDFESDNPENKRAIIRMLGNNMTISGRTINFSPVKWLIPIKKIAKMSDDNSDMVRTDFLQGSRTKKLPQSAVWCA